MEARSAMSGLWCLVLLAVVGATAKNMDATSRVSLDYNDIKVEEFPLHVPPLQEIADVLGAGMTRVFREVTATVEQSPDFRQSPYNLTAPGITGNAKLIDIGGMAYILPMIQREKVYDLAKLVRHLGRAPANLIGGGAGPWPMLGVNCEGIYDMNVYSDSIDQNSHLVYVVDPAHASPNGKGYEMVELFANETRVGPLGNVLMSDGQPGQVIKLVAKTRIGEDDFITAVIKVLQDFYGENIVGLGGVFMLNKGKVLHHVMPEFAETEMCTDDELNLWVRYYELEAPITHMGTLVTGDKNINLRPSHFHGWSQHGDAGHYHWDTTPEEVEYEAYFSLAQSVIRVDEVAAQTYYCSSSNMNLFSVFSFVSTIVAIMLK